MKRNFSILAVLALGMISTFTFAQSEGFVYNDHGKRDPFWKLVSPSGTILHYDSDLSMSDLTLEGIIFDPSGKSLAVINGMILKENDRVAVFLVETIEKNRVVLSKDQEKFVLELKKKEE